MCACKCNYFERVKKTLTEAFRRYGEFVGRWPVVVIVLNIVIFGGLGAGLAFLEMETDMEMVYFPKNSRALKDRQLMRNIFPNQSDCAYNPYSLNDADKAVSIIVRCISDGQSIFDPAVNNEISTIFNAITSLSSSSGMNYYNLCARDFNQRCVVDGEFILDPRFQAALAAGSITYPVWNTFDFSSSISGVTVTHSQVLHSATVLRLSFKLAKEDEDWINKFLAYMENVTVNLMEVTYETPQSLNVELDKSTRGDIIYFSLTIIMVCIYASVVSTGGNPVSTRGLLAFGGILAAGLGIVGSMGLLSIAGVKFVNIIGVIPFLIIGIGVDDMFLLMSSWSENLPQVEYEQTVKNVPKILGRTLVKAGIGITITSVTDFLAFFIGSFSVFLSVTNFSLYAGFAVLFCYIANASLFSACLALHGRRVYSSRHAITCQVSKSRKELKADGKPICYALLCGGAPPSKEGDDHSVFEKVPSKVLPLLFQYSFVSFFIIFLFFIYLAVSVYGALQLKQGLVLQDLVLDTSYYRKFLTITDEYFPIRVPVAFVVTKEQDYSAEAGKSFLELLSQAKNSSGMNSDFSRCWLESYQNSQYMNQTVPGDFVGNLRGFLETRSDFRSDVVMDKTNDSILASRCYVMSKPSRNQYTNAEMMERMRKLADNSPLAVLAYHWSFVAFEQFLSVLPATLQLVGIAVAVMTVVTFLLLPHPLMVLLVVTTIVMILVGIFGFMHYWGLTLSSITMIHLVMSVGFSVDFSAHVCAAYHMSKSQTRQERAADAIRHAAAPILNGAVSTLLGILFLLASSSYVFISFFKVMVLVIVFGMVHAVFFLPAILSILGPENKERKSGSSNPSASRIASSPVDNLGIDLNEK